ncbi:hypothetical protein GLOIN_2v1574867 [Rhizophagus clarus]|uniref:Uncharacterized protein n=1 Tax=Rhizophagus clarus TaxID=94130 RepID=A0A8H3KVP0_9GLOM|nr:hypothetical protein GLOIN_2v1574867 [Rhizophagus clarus]
MKVIQIILYFLAFIATFASATINIIFPSSQYYLVAGQTNEIMWTSDNLTDTLSFSMFLINPSIPDLKQFAIANNVDPRLGKKDVEIAPNINGTGFQLIFTNIGNIADVFATSQSFEIKQAGTTPIAYATPTPTPTPAPSTNNTAKSSSNSIHNYGFSVLVLTILLAIILF